MKIIRHLLLAIVFCISIGNISSFAQGRHGHNQHGNKNRNHVNRSVMPRGGYHGNRMFYAKSRYHPTIRVNYYPVWAHHNSYRRRWVFFPKYNFYYDNWRQVYYYQNNSQWYMNVNLPPTLIYINIENEKHFQLNEEEDDLDDIYNNNKNHNDSGYNK